VATLSELHEGLAARVSTAVRCSPFPTTVTPPCAHVTCAEATYDMAMGKGLDQYELEVFVFTSSAVDRAGYTALMALADATGEGSIRDAVWNDGDRSLGLDHTDVRVVGFRALALEEVEAFKAYGGVFTVRATTRGVAT
jgi:hypothetical protein